jgi:photoactive yellow protein
MSAGDLRAWIEGLPPSRIDELPFGVIRLDRAGKVVLFSRVEAMQSGFGDRPAIGRTFFTELAPCMGAPAFMERLARAEREGALDITFESVGDFADADRELRVRVISASDRGTWVFLQRLSQ